MPFFEYAVADADSFAEPDIVREGDIGGEGYVEGHHADSFVYGRVLSGYVRQNAFHLVVELYSGAFAEGEDVPGENLFKDSGFFGKGAGGKPFSVVVFVEREPMGEGVFMVFSADACRKASGCG